MSRSAKPHYRNRVDASVSGASGKRPLRTRLGNRRRSCAHASFAKGKQASAEAGPARPLVVRSGRLPNVV